MGISVLVERYVKVGTQLSQIFNQLFLCIGLRLLIVSSLEIETLCHPSFFLSEPRAATSKKIPITCSLLYARY